MPYSGGEGGEILVSGSFADKGGGFSYQRPLSWAFLSPWGNGQSKEHFTEAVSPAAFLAQVLSFLPGHDSLGHGRFSRR